MLPPFCRKDVYRLVETFVRLQRRGLALDGERTNDGVDCSMESLFAHVSNMGNTYDFGNFFSLRLVDTFRRPMLRVTCVTFSSLISLCRGILPVGLKNAEEEEKGNSDIASHVCERMGTSEHFAFLGEGAHIVTFFTKKSCSGGNEENAWGFRARILLFLL